MTPEIEKRIKAVKAGRVPAGYKKTKVGIVPKEWDVSPLSEYLEINNEKNVDGTYTIENVFSVSGEYGVVNQIEFMGRSYAGESLSGYRVVHPNDIIYTKSPLKSNPYGIVKANRTGAKGIVSVLYSVYHCSNKVLPYYVQLYFDLYVNLNNYLRPLVNIGPKHNMLISDSHVLDGFVPFPPLAEQKKIAEILSVQDKIIELKEKLIAEKQKQKHCLMKELLDETAKKPFKLNDVIVDKKKWKKIKLEDFASLKTGTLPTFTAEKGLYPFVNAGSDYSGYTNEYNCEGDVITTPSRGQGGIGEVFYQRSPFWLGPLSYRIKVSQGNSASYVFYIMLFNKRKIKDETKTGSIPAVNARDLGKLKYWLPPFPEQQVIASVLSSADEEISLLQRNLEQEKLKKKSLMQLLLTGLVRV